MVGVCYRERSVAEWWGRIQPDNLTTTVGEGRGLNPETETFMSPSSPLKIMIKWLISLVLTIGVILLILTVIVRYTFQGLNSSPAAHVKSVPMITVPPGGTVTAEFESFCLDHSRGGPRNNDGYTMMKKTVFTLRPYMGDILNEYLNNPSQWSQSDVQQGLWYTEGSTAWDKLTESQRQLIQKATGKVDPANRHPLILINSLYERFYPQHMISQALEFLLLVCVAALVATPKPVGLIASLLEWINASGKAHSLRNHRYSLMMDRFAGGKELVAFREQVDKLFRGICVKAGEFMKGKSS